MDKNLEIIGKTKNLTAWRTIKGNNPLYAITPNKKSKSIFPTSKLLVPFLDVFFQTFSFQVILGDIREIMEIQQIIINNSQPI